MRADLILSPPRGQDLTSDPNAVIEVRTVVRDPQADVPGVDEYAKWIPTLARRNQFVSAAVRNLVSGDGAYPHAEAIAMAASLEWFDGLGTLLDHADVPGWLRVHVTKETAALLPEMVPLSGENKDRWLDQIGPVYRVINPPPAVVRRDRPSMSLAIIFQDHPKIVPFVEALRRSIEEKAGIAVDTFCGVLLAGAPPEELDKIFRGHRAVLFVGQTEHLPTGACEGWWLDERGAMVLHKHELANYFGVHRDRDTAVQTKGAHAAQRDMAEVIFINGCGSVAAPNFRNGDELSYPELFLAAGARFVVGTAAEIDLRPKFTASFLVDFFARYARDPQMAVEHLYQTKCSQPAPDFQASLYQIYADREIVYHPPGQPAPEPIRAAEVAAGPVAENLAEGETVEIDGIPCVLGRELAGDASARMFFAEIAGRPVFVQILTEMWREQRGLEQALDCALGELQALKAGPLHLIPERRATARIPGTAGQVFQALLYLRAEGIEWASLSAQELRRDSEGDLYALLQCVLRWGALAASRLAELHGSHGAHGNIAPGSFLICRTRDGHENLVLKDAWLRTASPVRCAPAAYAAPECTGQSGGQPAEDCWSLGCILYELAAGQAPFDEENPPTRGLRRTLARALGLEPGARTVPEALNRVIRECLLPEPALRPLATKLAQRLIMASQLGGAYLSEFAETIHRHAEAGVRVLAVHNVHEHAELLDALQVLAAHDQPTLPGRRGSVRYQLFRMEPGLGLVACGPDGSLGRLVAGWVGAAELARGLNTRRELLTEDLVAEFNGAGLLPQAASLTAPPGGRALVVIRGSRWWNYGAGAVRLLSFCQSEPERSPLFIIADDEVLLPESAAGRAIKAIGMPSPSPAALFECILNFVADDGLAGVPAIEPPMAMVLARGFQEQPLRQVRVALRMCALAHGRIDERALELAEQEREARMSQRAGMSYLSVARLPGLNELGFERSTAAEIALWAANFRAAEKGEPVQPKRRVVVTGPPGSGRTSVALHLAAQLGRPVVTLDPGLCLGSALGESEQRLAGALGGALALGRVVIVIDNADRIFASPKGAPVESSLAKIAGRLRHWLENLPEPLVAVVTAENLDAMPIEWRRVLGGDFRIHLAPPDHDGQRSLRASVLAAVFRRHELAGLAGDAEFLGEFAGRTLDDTVPCPDAVAMRTGALRGESWNLKSSGDVAHWISSVLLLDDSPHEKKSRPDFWREAATRRAAPRP